MHKNYMNKLSISILNSLSSFREILDSKIHKVKGITRTESFMSIEETLKDGLSLN